MAAIRRGGFAQGCDSVDLILIANRFRVGLAAEAATRLRRRVTGCEWFPCRRRRSLQARTRLARSRTAGGGDAPHAIEAGVTEPWHRWVGPAGRIIGIDTFGKSPRQKICFKYFGFTPERIVKGSAGVARA